MQTQQTPTDLTRRFSTVNTCKEAKVSSETIAAQIAEFEQRGGKIQKIESPQFSIFPKRISAGHDPKFLETNDRLAEPSKTEFGDELVNLTRAAKLLNVHLSTVSSWVRDRKLKVMETRTRGEKMVKLSHMAALKNKSKQGDK